ncbi:uncharacterized protein BJ212DRAFT_1301850 [Suillus subaureus]|uniref:Uncharacterized protein n=1 Tax=Suillus subaureus TaxID=48587 RepID=A0A9P7JAZ2_9AGAM|nr:uncharacterized protein BJ212DRAFT_1301850 [Suillus subaureus]KAG1811835.1 hypothetical protein BJ212DRAFT_1301850 [Suillus subaureus]
MFYGPTVTHGNLKGSPPKQPEDAGLENSLTANPGNTRSVGLYKVTGDAVQAVIGAIYSGNLFPRCNRVGAVAVKLHDQRFVVSQADGDIEIGSSQQYKYIALLLGRSLIFYQHINTSDAKASTGKPDQSYHAR